MENIKNVTIKNEEYLEFLLYNALETNCENLIISLFNKLELLKVYNQIKSIFEFNPIIFNVKESIDNLKKIFMYNDKICMQTILCYACHYGYYETVEYLINQGSDIHANIYRTYSLLLDAEYNGHYNIVEYLIKNGADIHVNNDELLSHAIDNNDIERVKYWISKGLDIHIN